MTQTEREYASALFEIAVEENSVQEYFDALNTVKALLKDNPEYINFLASPAIPLSERIFSLDEAFGKNMPEHIVSFLKVICENGRSRSILGCIEEYAALAMIFSNRTEAVIYSAVSLSDEQKTAICGKLLNLTGKEIDPVYIIDESLIGGIKIEVDGKTFDGSIKHRLGEMKDVMNS